MHSIPSDSGKQRDIQLKLGKLYQNQGDSDEAVSIFVDLMEGLSTADSVLATEILTSLRRIPDINSLHPQMVKKFCWIYLVSR